MKEKSDATPADVAAWMFDELKCQKEIDQTDIVYDIERRFGARFTYTNEAGNPAISKDVLDAFKKITGNDVVWERSRRCWRFREKGDDPGRLQP